MAEYVRNCRRCGKDLPRDGKALTPYPWHLCLSCTLKQPPKPQGRR